MDIDDVWSSFATAMTEIHLYQLAAREAALQEAQNLQKLEDALKERNDTDPVSLVNMLFRSSNTGETIHYEQRRIDIDETRERVRLRKNRQYQWIMAEAYEAYEKFTKNLYALLGGIDKGFWNAKDYGDLNPSESVGKGHAWYVERLTKRRDCTPTILTNLRNNFPGIPLEERENFYEVNLRFVVTFISMLRHVVVHDSGEVQSKEEFIFLVLSKAGIPVHGDYAETQIDFAQHFFGLEERENLIVLIEYTDPEDVLPRRYYCRLSQLIERLVSHADLLTRAVRPALAQA